MPCLIDEGCTSHRALANVRLLPKQAQENITALNNIIWGTCNTSLDVNQCNANMAWFADSLRDQCDDDMKEENAIVLQTLKGMFHSLATANHDNLTLTTTMQAWKRTRSFGTQAASQIKPQARTATSRPRTTRSRRTSTSTPYRWALSSRQKLHPHVRHVRRA